MAEMLGTDTEDMEGMEEDSSMLDGESGEEVCAVFNLCRLHFA
jgi:hypothetical protein